MRKCFLLTFFFSCILILGLDIWSSYQFLNQLFRTIDDRREALEELHQFEHYLSLLKDAETGQRGFVITGDEEYLKPYENALQSLQSLEFKEFMEKQEQKPNAQHVEKIRKMRELQEKKLAELAGVIEKRKELGFIHAQKTIQSNAGKQHMDDLRSLGSSIIDAKKQFIQGTDDTIKGHTKATLFLFIIGDIASTLLIGFCFLYLYSYIKRLEQKDKELRSTAQKLSESLAARQAILNSANYAIIATDPKGLIMSFNPAAERILGYSQDEMVGKKTPEVFHDQQEMRDYARELSRRFRTEILPNFEVFVTLAKHNMIDTREWTYIRKNGSRFPVLLSITAIKDENNQVIGYMGIASDLSEQKEIDRMKDELIAITSHELRSPVASIKGTFDLLSQEGLSLSDQAKHILEIGKKNCERLTRLADDIVDIQHIELGKLKLSFRKINVSVLLSKAIQTNASLAQQAHVEIKSQLVPKNWFVEGDEGRLLQVLNKLILNAMSYSPKQGIINIEAHKMDSRIRIEVQSEGIGISKEFESKVFETFSRDPSIVYAEKKGTGLGLNIAKSVIEKHHGVIGFETDRKGMSFWFELPLFEVSHSI